MSYEIIHKPTFTNQLLALPRNEMPGILEKIELLREAPQPDAKNKKRLQGYKHPVFRIRAGVYRIIYAFGEGWVALLGVDHRKDVYDGDQLVDRETDVRIETLPGTDELLTRVERTDFDPISKPKLRSAENDLPVKLDEAFLRQLLVPDGYIPALVGCKTIDDLAEANAPDSIRTRIFDVIMSPNYDRVVEQPSFVTGDVNDLLRFAEGELVEFLLKLDPDQEKFVTWSLRGAGPTLVKGGPGSGKSTIALYRAKSLIEALRKDGVAEPRLLFTTYTNALVASSRQLLRRLLGEDERLVDVRTADNLVMEIVTATDGKVHMIDSTGLQQALTDAIETAQFDGNALQRRAQAQTIANLTHDYLIEEIGGVIVARELATLEDYLAASRTGRRVPLNATQRTAVWRVHESLERALQRRNQITWTQLRARAVALVRAGTWPERYDGVIVDEAQDLDPTVLRLLVELCRTPDRLFVTADANQSIYGSGFRWSDVHADLRFQGRTGLLRHNYRSTREIGSAATAYLRGAALDEDEGETGYRLSGPFPTVRAVQSAYDETQLLNRFLTGAVRQIRLGIGSCAVLVPSETAGKAIAARLRELGMEIDYMPGRELDLERRVAKVITQKSAKGLEFPIVALAGFLEGYVPGAAKGAGAEEREEAELRERRTMYVAMTRAMQALLVVTPAGHSSPLFAGFGEPEWNTGAGASGA